MTKKETNKQGIYLVTKVQAKRRFLWQCLLIECMYMSGCTYIFGIRGHTLITLAQRGTYLVCIMLTAVL